MMGEYVPQKKKWRKKLDAYRSGDCVGCLVNRADTVPGVSGLLIATLSSLEVIPKGS